MTGFAATRGGNDTYGWSWDLRSVNAKGLDVRFRIPDWLPGLEARLRARTAERMARGGITVSLRISRISVAPAYQLNQEILDQLLSTLSQIEARAGAAGVALTPASVADVLNQRGVMEQAAAEDDTTGLMEDLMSTFAIALEELATMRAQEGRVLRELLLGHVARIETLVGEAVALVVGRRTDIAASTREALRKVASAEVQFDPQRLEQELALIAVKTDITEELDRLTAHVAAARDLLDSDGPAGRRMDFLAQEFNREANTLCSKSQHPELTTIGLDLKAAIDQMREQVQNLE
ncbi:YicC/YloC family endoribonuclease [Pseudooceanicola sp. C21-150M6]|uniref:YicC/YloC family endoribonuclease n=1 Tax=Pseudooceanicola sp. C21-150M6 TaxID=3434355 RepID=UPI003D7F70C8